MDAVKTCVTCRHDDPKGPIPEHCKGCVGWKLWASKDEPIHDTHTPKAIDVQVGGNHYKDMVIQPITYIMANNIPFAEGNAIKYVSRWRKKGGIADLRKAIHMLEVIIETEEKANA